MADNTELNTGTGGDIIATDDIGGVKFQRVKLVLGDNGINAGDVSKTNSLPIRLSPISPVNISGTITTGGTAQVLAIANTTRKGWWIRNNSTESLWLSDMTTAIASQPSLELRTGELYESAVGGCSSLALSILGATTGSSFTAREF